jgi:hypothetical protein
LFLVGASRVLLIYECGLQLFYVFYTASIASCRRVERQLCRLFYATSIVSFHWFERQLCCLFYATFMVW